MRTVLLRDDDTNAFTPIACLEKLYRPFLDRGLPVNLAVIPEVNADARLPDGRREGFLFSGQWTGDSREETGDRAQEAKLSPVSCHLSPDQPELRGNVPLARSPQLVEYLHANAGYHVMQHGCHHDHFEFDCHDRAEVTRRLDRGARHLREAGFKDVKAFVAPHDKLSRVAYEEAARRFSVISTGWFEWRRLPVKWHARYLVKKILGRPHWQIGETKLFSHPGCILSYTRPLEMILPSIEQAIAQREVTVLVTHWWEYFRHGIADEPFIRVLHETAAYLASRRDVRVISFGELAREKASRGLSPLLAQPTIAPAK